MSTVLRAQRETLFIPGLITLTAMVPVILHHEMVVPTRIRLRRINRTRRLDECVLTVVSSGIAKRAL